jgi:hypothetical protein
MDLPDFSQWAPMRTAPRDGTLVLARVRATEQGPAEIDMVRWARSARSGEENWVANDSDPYARVIYAESELACWLPLPTQLPKLRSQKPLGKKPLPASGGGDESDGGGI